MDSALELGTLGTRAPDFGAPDAADLPRPEGDFKVSSTTPPNSFLFDRRSASRRRSRGDGGRLSPSVVVGLVRTADLLLLLCAGMLAACGLRWSPQPRPDGSLFLAALGGGIIFVVLLGRAGAYTPAALNFFSRQFTLLPSRLIAGAGGLIAFLFFTRSQARPFREWTFLWLALGFLLLTIWRFAVAHLMRSLNQSGRMARRVAVVGVGEFSRKFIERLREEPDAYTIVGLYDDRLSRAPAAQDGIAVRGTVSDLLERSRQEKIDVIAVALPLSAAERIEAILEQLGSAVADVCLTTGLTGLHYTPRQISALGGNPVIMRKEEPLKDWGAVKKFAFDVILASLLLLVLFPFLVLIALLICLDSPGPVLFRQPRLGFNNRLFTCYKFRTMHHSMGDALAGRQTTRDDPRVTRLGKWLRRFSIDELPQLINVLRGNMSLVGPRPHAPNTKAGDRPFASVVAQYASRHRIKPGITGWAQVNGWRGETTTAAQIEGRVACDLEYIEDWSLCFDLRILWLTLCREIVSRNAY